MQFPSRLIEATCVVFILNTPLILSANPVARDRAVEVSAIVSSPPATIDLQWNEPNFPVDSQELFRRTSATAPWGAPIALTTTATGYSDSSVIPGQRYEYKIVRQYQANDPLPAYGYIEAGMEIPLVDERGTVILIVDSEIATPAAAELQQFAANLVGDGWKVIRSDVDDFATVSSIKSTIQSHYADDPVNTHALILIGDIPTPRSGYYDPDGHETPKPLPADLYYADMDGVWTDNVVNVPGKNIPGDGIFDHNSIAEIGNGKVELQMGRIDFSNLSTWTELEAPLIQRYLTRNHKFRHQLDDFSAIPRRGLARVGFGYFDGEAPSRIPYINFPPLFGANNVDTLEIFPHLESNPYLFTYAAGGGSTTSLAGWKIQDFHSRDYRSVFNLFFGSGFMDWDTENALMRGALAGTVHSQTLTVSWGNRPGWYVHHMALGTTIGFSAQVTQNYTNSPTTGYFASNEFVSSYPEVYINGAVHIALMGDPTLRLHTINPPSNLLITLKSGQPHLTWTASPDSAVLGYHVYRSNTANGPFPRVTAVPITNLEFIDQTAIPGETNHYQVKAIKLETSGSGTYYNSSQAAAANFPFPLTPLHTWRLDHFGTYDNTGESADFSNPDGDSYLNLVEYAMDFDPHVATADSSLNPTLAEFEVDGTSKSYLSIAFNRDPAKFDINYIIEVSTDLSTWVPVASSLQGNPTSGPGLVSETGTPIKTVIVRDTVSIDQKPTRFMQLRVTRP